MRTVIQNKAAFHRSIPGRGREFFSSPCSNRQWGPPILLSNGYLGLIPWG